MPRKTTEERADGLVSAISGLGIVGRDKSIANTFGFVVGLSNQELDAIYRGKGLGRRIVNLPVLEMTREWFDVEGDPKNLVIGYLETIKAKQAIQEALRWGDLYGGSLVVMGLDDGVADLALPVNLNRLNGIKFLHVYDRNQVTWTTADLYVDPREAKFNQPERYTVNPPNASRFQVHETRTLRFIGAQVPSQTLRETQGWGDSVLQGPYEELRNFTAGHAHAANILEEWAIGVVTIKNLVQLLAAKGGEAKVKQRIETMDYGKSILRSLILADGETFDKKTASVSGLPEVLDRMAQALSAATEYGIPVSLMFGEQPSGLQATGEYAQTNWYDSIKCAQESKLQGQLETLVRYVFLSKKGPTRGKETENWKIAFKPLRQMDEQQEAELRDKVADTDVKYIREGVLTPEEVAISRFGGDRWSSETVIDEKLHEAPDPDEQKAADEPPVPPVDGNGATEPTVMQ